MNQNTNEITRFDILNSLIEVNGFKKYLEIGFQQGICFNAVNCEYKLAVDPAPVNTTDRLFLGTSDEFFAVCEQKFDLIFIDGLHVYEQVKRDLINAVKCLNHNGLIMLHDMNPSSEERAKSFLDGGQWNGDCYKVAIDLWRGEFEYDYYTIDEDNGCMIVNPFHTVKRFANKELEFDYSYAFLDKNRAAILNFQPLG